VLSKCASPACLSRLHYLRKGRIFKVETGGVRVDGKRAPTRRIEYFWLCERCVQTLTVVVENGVVATRPLYLELSEGAPRGKSGSDRDVA
jgi:hypothetical protein